MSRGCAGAAEPGRGSPRRAGTLLISCSERTAASAGPYSSWHVDAVGASLEMDRCRGETVAEQPPFDGVQHTQHRLVRIAARPHLNLETVAVERDVFCCEHSDQHLDKRAGMLDIACFDAKERANPVGNGHPNLLELG